MEKEQGNFVLGIAIGVAVVSLGGMIFMSTGDNNTNTATPPANTGQNAVADSAANNQQPPQPPQPVDIAVKDTDWTRGAKDAKVTVIEFSDIQCPYCSRHHETMRQIVEAYPNDVQWVFKHFPLDSIHPIARKASEASECAGEQDKFWEYLDYLFENQTQLSNDFLKTAATTLKLDATKFNGCLDGGKYASKVQSDYQEGLKYGVNGTPGNFINGQSVPGALPYATMESIIQSEL